MCKDEFWIYLCSNLYSHQLQSSNTQTKTDPSVFPFTQTYYPAHTIAGSAFAVKAESEHSCLLLHLQHKPPYCMSGLLPNISHIHP